MKKSLLVLGGGESGTGAALLAKKEGYQVLVSDHGPIAEKYKTMLQEANVPYEENGHSFETFFEFSEVVKSPGIPDQLEFIQAFGQQGIPVISEIEFAARFTDAYIIAITGSNGKTTTTNLVYQILKYAGKDVALVGNVGQSFAWRVAFEPAQIYALELSSFQLDGIKQFRPNISILLNISPDHLDRYAYDFDAYADSKLRITMNQTKGDVFIYNGDDTKTLERLNQVDSLVERIAVDRALVEQMGQSFEWTNRALSGRHNQFNASCVIQAMFTLGLSPAAIQQGLDAFVNDPHRLELFLESQGIEFVNDSKATNVDAVFFALDAAEKPVIWIVGGVDKGNDYKTIDALVQDKVEAIIALGTDNSAIMNYFENKVPLIESTDSLESMLEKIQTWAKPGMQVLLSPACASFDLFRNYMHRGEAFKEIILKNYTK